MLIDISTEVVVLDFLGSSASYVTYCVTLGKLLNFFVTFFPYLWNQADSVIVPISQWELNEEGWVDG